MPPYITSVTLDAENYPTREAYPFSLPILQQTPKLVFNSPITFFAGENGTGKSTLLEAISVKCGIYIWRGMERTRSAYNPHEREFYRYIKVAWSNGTVPGAFFASEIFKNFAQILDEWAANDPGLFDYFGGKSLMTQSHGQSLMSYFKSRFKLQGLYLLDEPESALSPKRQIELLELLKNIQQDGQAQFIIATHSPILLSCPGARIYSFDAIPIQPIKYEATEHYRVYRDFLNQIDTAG